MFMKRHQKHLLSQSNDGFKFWYLYSINQPMKSILITLLCLGICIVCNANQATFKVDIEPDDWAYEINWSLYDDNNTLISSVINSESAELLVDENSCYKIIIEDSYGDGIASNEGINLYWNDELIENITGDFGSSIQLQFNCSLRATCSSAEIISTGEFTLTNTKEWFQFIAVSTGRYSFSTCNNDYSCNTKIAAFQNCYADISSTNVQGTILFNDDYCEEKAKVQTVLDAGTTLLIRVETEDLNCNNQNINFEIQYEGEVEGCTDSNADNFQPRATIDNGSCIYANNDNAVGPDLIIVQDELVSSLYHEVIENDDDCMIEEGCLTGYGQRDVVRFTTHIKNIGTTDYVVGATDYYPDQFTFDNCHQHWHYDGYAEYILYNEAGAQIPVGFKNGFCIEDIECSGGAVFTYNCFYMGIANGCGDVYSAEIDCQWIDVTDVADGTYTLVMKVNWDNAPDALGNYELDYTNNFAQACFNIERDANGQMQFSIEDTCPEFLDCQGNPYGTATFDCENVCAGSTYYGDMDGNQNIEIADADIYVHAALSNNTVVNNCNDISQDGVLSLFDAALIVACTNYQQGHEHDNGTLHNHCNLPGGIVNTNDSVFFKMSNVNEVEGYFEIEVKNKNNKILGYQLNFDGIGISATENLIDPNEYDESVQFITGLNRIIAMSYTDEVIDKDEFYKPLCRVYYQGDHNGFTCINASIDVINHNYEKTLTFLEEPCRSLGPVGINENINKPVQLNPNPFKESSNITIEDFNLNDTYSLYIYNWSGKLVRTENNINSLSHQVNRKDLKSGSYLLVLIGKDWQHTFKTLIY